MKFDEPSNRDMDDYDGKESSQKRRVIWLVVVVCLLAGLALSQFDRSTTKDFIMQTTPDSGAKK